MKKFYCSIASAFLAALVALPLLPGCATWDEITHGSAMLVVNNSPLNWLEIWYLKKPGDPTTHLTMRDKGEVRIERGRSKLVNSAFAQEYDEDAWGDRQGATFWVDHAKQVEVFQTLVNFGLLKFPKEPDARPEKAILVKGNLNGRKIDRYVFDEDLILQIESILHLYSRSLEPR